MEGRLDPEDEVEGRLCRGLTLQNSESESSKSRPCFLANCFSASIIALSAIAAVLLARSDSQGLANLLSVDDTEDTEDTREIEVTVETRLGRGLKLLKSESQSESDSSDKSVEHSE